MQFCNEQIRTRPLFSPPCVSATYGSARMCRRKNICGAGRCAPPYTPVQVCPSRYHKMLLNAYAYQNPTNKKPICIYTFIFIHSFIVEPVSVMTRLHSILTNDFVTCCCMYQGNNARNAFNNTSWSHCRASWSCMGSANDRRRYNVMSLIDWARTWPWGMTVSSNTYISGIMLRVHEFMHERWGYLWRHDMRCKPRVSITDSESPGARLTKAYDVTIQRYRNSHAKIENSKIHILQCMDSKFFVKFQRCPFKDTRSVYMWI